jgi:hypothetical protein
MRLELNGEVQDFPVTGVGGTTRVAVGKVGRRSSIWRIWANKSTSDVYVAARTVAGEQKFSLHESGDWRYAWTSEAAEALGGALPSRVKDRWRRGDPDEIGWTPALSIWVRSEDVTEMPDDTKSEEVRWVERPPVGWVVGIHLLFIQPDLGGRALIGFRIVDVLRLANGHGLMVMTGARPITSQEVDHIAEGRTRAFAEVPEIVARSGEPGLRVAIFGYTDDGHRTVWDTALDPYEEGEHP